MSETTENENKSSDYFNPNPPTDAPESKPRGRRPKQTDMATELSEPGELVTYLPGEGDPASVKWNGHLFNAHVPKRITDEAMIQSARTNKFWHVGHFDVAAREAALSAVSDLPATADQYRAHVVGWLKNVTTIHDLVKTWAAEHDLREACGVGSDDYSFIGSLFNPKMHELQQAAELNNTQMAELWRTYRVFQLPF